MQPLPVALVDDLRSYLDHLAVERGLARNTLQSYRRDLTAYIRFLAAQGVISIDAATPTAIADFLAHLRHPVDGAAPHAASSVARALVAVRGWHRYLVLEGRLDSDPTVDISAPKLGQRLPKALTIDEVSALLAAAGVDGPRQLRDRALLELLYATGARISEAIGLDVDDIDPAAGSVRLFGKGSKERVVPVGSFAQAALDAYLVRGRPSLAAARRTTRMTRFFGSA